MLFAVCRIVCTIVGVMCVICVVCLVACVCFDLLLTLCSSLLSSLFSLLSSLFSLLSSLSLFQSEKKTTQQKELVVGVVNVPNFKFVRENGDVHQNGWILPGKSNIIINMTMDVDMSEGPTAMGRLVGRNMDKMPLNVSVKSEIPVLLILFPFPVYFIYNDLTTFACMRPGLEPMTGSAENVGKYNLTKYADSDVRNRRLTGGSSAELPLPPNYVCGASDTKILKKSTEMKNKTKNSLKHVGFINTPGVRENMTMVVALELFLPLNEISVNFPTVEVDVTWPSSEEEKTIYGNVDVAAPVLRVSTHPMSLSHGWTTLLINVTVDDGDGGSPEGRSAGVSYQVDRLQKFMRDFLEKRETILSITGTNMSTSSDYRLSKRPLSMPQHIAAYIDPPITIPIKDKEKNITKAEYFSNHPCTIDTDKGAIELHEFIAISFFEETLSMELNLTFNLPFFLWGDIPSVSMDINVPGIRDKSPSGLVCGDACHFVFCCLIFFMSRFLVANTNEI